MASLCECINRKPVPNCLDLLACRTIVPHWAEKGRPEAVFTAFHSHFVSSEPEIALSYAANHADCNKMR